MVTTDLDKKRNRYIMSNIRTCSMLTNSRFLSYSIYMSKYTLKHIKVIPCQIDEIWNISPAQMFVHKCKCGPLVEFTRNDPMVFHNAIKEKCLVCNFITFNI